MFSLKKTQIHTLPVFAMQPLIPQKMSTWISMATMYANLCGNCVGRIELTFLRQFIVAQFLKLSSQCAMV
jgi:hypothetical protein